MDNYPDTTWAGDPNAPWNREPARQECSECMRWHPVPLDAAAGLGFCSEFMDYTEPNEMEECDGYETI